MFVLILTFVYTHSILQHQLMIIKILFAYFLYGNDHLHSL